MNKKQKMDLDTISKIDDDIIEKNTEKRIRLLRKKSKIVRNRTIAAIAAAALLLTALVSMFLILSGRPDAKQVPIYQGMTAHAYNNDSTVNAGGMSISFLSAGSSDQGFDWLKDGDNGNHNGHDENGKDTSAETEAESSSLEIGEQEIVFYTRPNTDFYIKVHISNPDNYEILSFTLNGKKYSSYMFEEGSDMENLILKCNVGDAEGIIEYTIDAIKYVDGTEIKDVVMEGNRTIKIGVYTYNQPVATISKESTGLESISFDISISDELELIEMSGGRAWVELTKGGVTVACQDISLTEKSKVSFEDLEIGTEYEYEVVALFDALDGKGTINRTINSGRIKTKSVFDVTQPKVTQESASFGVEWNDTVTDKTLKTLALYRGDEKIKDLATDATSVDSLLSGVEYTLVGLYEYNGQTVTVKRVFTTIARAEPTFTVKKLSSDMHEVIGDYVMTDTDGTLISYTVKLFKGKELVEDSADKKIEFYTLDYYTEYTVKINYTFDVNDGKGVQEKTVEKGIKTLPYIDVIQCQVANTSAVSEGDTIFMQVQLDNPVNMAVEAVVVNGEKYNVTGQSTTERIFVEIVYNGQFAGGNTYLKVDEIIAKIDDVSLTVPVESELSDNVFINGRLEVLKLECVNEMLEPVDWAFPNEKVYVMLTLDNSTGYIVDEIKVSNYNGYSSDGIKCTRIDDNHWYFDPVNCLNNETGWNSIELNSLSYHNEHVNKNLPSLDMKVSYFKLASEGKVYVSTPEDLKNMKDGYYYELTGDIDLSDIEWYGNEFCGVFEGNGYSVKNLSYVSTVNSSLDLGLFTRGTGFIQNLNMEKVTIIAECDADDKNWIDLYCGSLVARPYGLRVNNCTMDEDSFISITTSVTDGRWISVGGLLGGDVTDSANDANVRVTDCVNRASCSVTGSQSFVGGIIGIGGSGSLIQGCVNYGMVSGTNNTGGIIGNGDTGDDDSAIVKECINYAAIIGKDEGGAGGISGGGGLIGNCINYGSVSIESNGTENNAGGIVSWAGNASVFNCLNVGTVKGSGKRTGGIAAERWNSEIFSCINLGQVSSKDGDYCALYYDDNLGIMWKYNDCYAIKPHMEFEPSCTAEQLNSNEFYTEILGWSEDVWDFSELDFENGKYPKLK